LIEAAQQRLPDSPAQALRQQGDIAIP
jgi:CTP synthase